MLNQLENYYWRYTSASQLVNTILNYVDPRANNLFGRQEYLQLSESMLQTILTRQNVNLSETKKFQVMFQWSLHKVKNDKLDNQRNEKILNANEKISTARVSELQTIMNRLTRDLKLHKIPPHDLIKIVLPSKTISHERILATLLYQADSGIYRNSEFGN
jgi:RAP1 GTPase activating protein 1